MLLGACYYLFLTGEEVESERSCNLAKITWLGYSRVRICTCLIFFPLFLFYCCSSTVVCLSPPHLYPHPSHPHLPPLIPPIFGFVHVSFRVIPENPFPFLPHYPLPLPSSGYCPFVLNFNVSGYNLLAYLFC